MSHVLPGHVPMTHVRVANCILLMMFGLGLGEGALAPSASYIGFYLLAALTTGYLLFLWYAGDADARGIKRSRVLGAAIVVLPLAAMPFYLLRSRSVTECRLALSAFLGLMLFAPLAFLAGVGLHLTLCQMGT